MYIETSELKTHLTDETVLVVSGGDETLLTAAIDGATVEAKGYLSAYDTETIFKTSGGGRNPLLLIFIKDIAAWHFLNLCNAGAEFKVRQDRYERAIAWLKSVQRGEVNPDLPRKESKGADLASGILFGSNTKRTQHF